MTLSYFHHSLAGRILAGLLALLQPLTASSVLFVGLFEVVTPSAHAQEPASKPAGGNSHKINHKVPAVSPPSGTLTFHSPPTERDFYFSNIFAEPLIPLGAASASEDQALEVAVQGFAARKSQDDFSSMEGFLSAYPTGRWALSVKVDLGIEYRKSGWYSKALAIWKDAWNQGQNVSETDPVRPNVDRGLGELAELQARLGEQKWLEALFAQIKDRNVSGITTEKLRWAHDGMLTMEHHPSAAFRCGPLAVTRVFNLVNSNNAPDSLANAPSTDHGTNLAMLVALGAKNGLPLSAVQHQVRTPWPFPSVIHWRVGHFAAITKQDPSGLYQVEDPTFGTTAWISQTALDSETSGEILATPELVKNLPALSLDQQKAVWGKGSISAFDAFMTHLWEWLVGPASGQKPCPGMPVFGVQLPLISLTLRDEPIGYTPPVGPSVDILLVYNQMEASQPSSFTYSNMGPKWLFPYTSFVTDNPLNPSANVTVACPGGGSDTYTGFTSTGGSTGTYTIQPESMNSLVKTGSASYVVHYPNGAVDTYSVSNGATGSTRLIFLTSRSDPQGNSVSLTYDSSYRIVAITDACGEVTTLTYGLPSDTLKITQVTDPFGRSASFAYTSGQLTSLTDEIGMTSSVTYGTGSASNSIVSLTTPYGTSKFFYSTTSTDPTDRVIQTVDPLGATTVSEYANNNGVYEPGVFTKPTVPGVTYNDSYMNTRNTFFWGPQAFMEHGQDPAYADLTIWCHDAQNNSNCSDVKEAEQSPGTSMIWYTYPGQTNTATSGTLNAPSTVARILPDNSTQYSSFTYNSLGNVSASRDPIGRTVSLSYASNNQDVTQVTNTTAGGSDVLLSMTYNSMHQPLTITDAGGNETLLTYNSYGQTTSVEDATGATTSYTYNGSSHLLTLVSGAMTGNSTTLTYDSYNRVQSVTDGDGYSLSYSYDNLDRLLSTTYPSGEYTQTVYSLLDPIWQRSKDGKWSYTYFDASRRPVIQVAPNGAKTIANFCACGALLSIQDPSGGLTKFSYNPYGELAAKTFQDGSTESYTYDSVGRLSTLTDPKGQVRTITYNADNTRNKIHITNTTVATPDVTFSYDSKYLRLTSMADASGTTNYSYNAVGTGVGSGLLASIAGPYQSSSVAYSYDVVGRVNGATTDGSARSVSYDALGRVTGSSDPVGSSIYSYASNADARLASMTLPNSVTVNYAYYGNTGDKKVQEIKNQIGGTVASQFDLTYNPDDSVASLTTQQASITTSCSYDYDALGRLLGSVDKDTSGNIIHQWAYTYDAVGNRLTSALDNAATTWSYNSLNQLLGKSAGGSIRFGGVTDKPALVSVNGHPATQPSGTNFVAYPALSMGTNTVSVVANDFDGNSTTNNFQYVVSGPTATAPTYDADGNTLDDGTNTYAWDGYNHLVTITNKTSGCTSNFVYDGLGRRVRDTEKNGSGTVTSDKEWIYGQGDQLLEEWDAVANSRTKQFDTNGELVGLNSYTYTADYRGSIREMIGSSGIAAEYSYDPYGATTKLSGSIDSDFQFDGYYLHGPSGLLLSKFRPYSPNIGRWLSRDLVASINPYDFAGDDPVDLIDPLGLYPILVVVLPDGTSYTPVTRVKNSAQAKQYGMPVNSIVPIAVPKGVDPEELHNEFDGKTGFGINNGAAFYAFWWPGGSHDYKTMPNGAKYDAFGNWELGASGQKGGFSLPFLEDPVDTGKIVASYIAHFGTTWRGNDPINKADIMHGYKASEAGAIFCTGDTDPKK